MNLKDSFLSILCSLSLIAFAQKQNVAVKLSILKGENLVTSVKDEQLIEDIFLKTFDQKGYKAYSAKTLTDSSSLNIDSLLFADIIIYQHPADLPSISVMIRRGKYVKYAQNEYKPNQKLSVNLGLRFDQAQGIVNENQLSPRITSLYQFNSQTKIHGGFAQYFTAPKAELVDNRNPQIFKNTTNQSENNDSSPLKSERNNFYDLGVSHKFNKSLTLAIDGYFKDIKNLLDEGQFGNAMIYSQYNFQKAKIYGLDISADYKKENFSAYANLAYQKARAHKIGSGQYLLENNEIDFISKNYVFSLGTIYYCDTFFTGRQSPWRWLYF